MSLQCRRVDATLGQAYGAAGAAPPALPQDPIRITTPAKPRRRQGWAAVGAPQRIASTRARVQMTPPSALLDARMLGARSIQESHGSTTPGAVSKRPPVAASAPADLPNAGRRQRTVPS